MYLTDCIGDAYRSWGDEHILISSPTGSGKTTFILKKLLPEAIASGQYLLYLCNRRFLDRQFEQSLWEAIQALCTDSSGNLSPELAREYREKIIVHTYQSFEASSLNRDTVALDPVPEEYAGGEAGRRSLCRHDPRKTVSFSCIRYFIYDEAHYFLADSLFNSSCNYWFDRISCSPISFPFRPQGTHIFLTATPEPLRLFFAAHLLLKAPLRAAAPLRTLFDDIYQTIRSEFLEKGTLKREAEAEPICIRIDSSHPNSQPTRTVTKNPQKAELLEQCRRIQPGKSFLETLQSLASSLPIREYSALSDSVYQAMETSYFRDFMELLPVIQSSAAPDSKWLIFVDKEREGIDLAARLQSSQISAVFLSSPSLRQDPAAYKEFQHIVADNSFQSQVLISTSVMDCGVSITDPAVRHVAVSHHNRTTFLQMLGRRRLKGQEQIHIYVRFFTAKQINGVIHTYTSQLQFMASYGLRDHTSVVPHCCHDRYGRPCTSYPEIPLQDNRQRTDLIRQSALPVYRSLLYLPKKTYLDKNPDSGAILNDQEPGKAAFVYLLGLLYAYRDVQEAALQEARERAIQEEKSPDAASPDPLYYLKYQLSWLGQTYSEKNWLTRNNTLERLRRLLQDAQDKTLVKSPEPPCGCVSTEAFSRDCMELLETVVPPLQALKSCLLNHRTPGLAILNRSFQELGLPYTIRSRSTTVGGKRCTVWKVCQTG